MYIFWCRNDICSSKLSANASLMLDNPFPVQLLCKLKSISICFTHNSMTITCKYLTSLKKTMFLKMIPSDLCHSINFNTDISLRWPVFPDFFLFLVTMLCHISTTDQTSSAFNKVHYSLLNF